MRRAVIVGPRFRASNNIGLLVGIEKLLKARHESLESVLVGTMSCNNGFGKDIKEFCAAHEIRVIEYTIFFNGPIHQQIKDDEHLYANIYWPRHAALAEFGEEFYFAVTDHGEAVIKLIKDVKPGASNDPVVDCILRVHHRTIADYFVFNEDNKIIQQRVNGTCTEEAA